MNFLKCWLKILYITLLGCSFAGLIFGLVALIIWIGIHYPILASVFAVISIVTVVTGIIYDSSKTY